MTYKQHPCINCIVLPICRSCYLDHNKKWNLPSSVSGVRILSDKCSLLENYLITRVIDDEGTFREITKAARVQMTSYYFNHLKFPQINEGVHDV
jgi:hypothetical protein